MLTAPDNRTAVLAFFGRVADALTAETVPAADYKVNLQAPPVSALNKGDGFFVLQDLRPSPVAYQFRFQSLYYQSRSFQKALPTPDPVEVAFGGEDEVYVALTGVNAGATRVTFDNIPFLPRIPKDAPVFGPGGFSTTLKLEMAGIDITSATLNSVAALAPGNMLRIVRSSSLAARPGPYYHFPSGLTRLALKLAEDSPAEPALDGAKALLKKVNAQAVSGTLAGGVLLQHVTLPGPGPVLMLGTARDLETFSDARGQAVFFFPGHWPITDLEIEFSHPGHLPKTLTLAVTAAQRTLATVKLVPA